MINIQTRQHLSFINYYNEGWNYSAQIDRSFLALTGVFISSMIVIVGDNQINV